MLAFVHPSQFFELAKVSRDGSSNVIVGKAQSAQVGKARWPARLDRAGRAEIMQNKFDQV